MTKTTTVVIPCYNEADRLDGPAFLRFLDATENGRFLFVNDGSTDETARVIDDLAAGHDRVDTLHLERNAGKAEAVRRGFVSCLDATDYAGYWDADLSTPLDEIPAFVDTLDTRPEIDIVTGARIKMVGRRIDRNPFRHYSGRAFATAVSLLFGIEMYDTQCGAKLFRSGPDVAAIFADPFTTRWIFDVELFVRFGQRAGKSIDANLVEIPLAEWREVAGSRMRPTDFLRAPLELIRIHFAYFGVS